MGSCQIGSLTYTYAYYLQNGRQEANSLFCKLSWLATAQPVIDSYIPVGTLISDTGQNACGLTSTVVGFAPTPPIVGFVPTVFTYNGNPLILPSAPTLIAFMDNVVSALTASSGVQWSYTQISEWEFLLCAPYTQNGDVVIIQFEVFGETSLGFIDMTITLSGGIAPDAPEYQTAEDNCIYVTQYDSMVETAGWIKKGVKCCDITKPTPCEPETLTIMPTNLELREGSGGIEEREGL